MKGGGYEVVEGKTWGPPLGNEVMFTMIAFW